MQTPTNRAEQNWMLGVTALASFMMALDAMIITTAFAAIPSLDEEFERCQERKILKIVVRPPNTPSATSEMVTTLIAQMSDLLTPISKSTART